MIHVKLKIPWKIKDPSIEKQIFAKLEFRFRTWPPLTLESFQYVFMFVI